MNTPLVTIAIPTYNRANSFLKGAIEGALNQTYGNIEILVSDNCSSDHTPELVRSYSDQRLKYFRQEENLGHRKNMNFLLEQAKGDYFHMHHDDDRIDPDFVEICMEAANFRNDKGLIITGARIIDEHGNIVREKENNAQGLTTSEFILFWYQKRINIFLCTSLFGTKALRQTGGFDIKYNNYIDVAAQFNCAAAGERVDIREIKASFREHPGSHTSSTVLDEWCNDSKTLLDLACSLAPDKRKELQNIGMRTSADRVYRYASEVDSKIEQLKNYWRVFKEFDYKYLPSIHHSNMLIPLSGYFLHPYNSLSLLKNRLRLKKFSS